MNLRLPCGFETRQRLVQQQQPWLRGQDLRDFQRLQLGQREFGGGIAGGAIGKLDKVEDLRLHSAVHAARAEALRHRQVFRHAQRMHRLRDLEGTPDSAARARAYAAVRAMSTPSKRNVPRCGFTVPEITLKSVGLAGAVGADEPDDLAGRDGKRHAVRAPAGRRSAR